MKSFRRILISILILALLLPVLCMTGSAGSGKTIAQLFPIDDGLVVVLYADGTVRASDPALNRKVSSWQHVSQLQYVMPTGEPVVLAGLLDSGEVVCTDPYIPSWRNVSKLYLYRDGAIAVTNTGSVLTCGKYVNGSFFSSLRNVEDLVHSYIMEIFGCLKKDGTVCFGQADSDGNFEALDYDFPSDSPKQNIAELYDSGHGFYYIMKDGSVFCDIGGSCPGLENVSKIYCYRDSLFGVSDDGELLLPDGYSIYGGGGVIVLEPSDSTDWDASSEYPPRNYTDIADIAFLGPDWILLKNDGTIDTISGYDRDRWATRRWNLRSWKHVSKIYVGSDAEDNLIVYAIRKNGQVLAAAAYEAESSHTIKTGFERYRIEELYVGHDGVIGRTTDGKLIGTGVYASVDFSVFY